MTFTTDHAILFRSATVVAGEEDSVPFEADVLVVSGVIVKIDTTSSNIDSDGLPENTRVIDAQGYYLCPGFIDMHAHSDLYLLSNPEHAPKITQGCTVSTCLGVRVRTQAHAHELILLSKLLLTGQTEVVGQDGISYAPVRSTEQLDAIRAQIAGWNGNPSEEECATKLAGVGMFEWRTVKEYLDTLDRNRTATNVAMLVPQGNLRLLACGPYDAMATEAQIEDQVQLLRGAMADGAVGMSSGLTYTPGMYASTSELAVLCKVLADEYPGAYYAPHHRSYGLNALGSYAEMLGLAEETGCPVHLTHASMNFSENKGRAPELIDLIDTARTGGADITLDTYPYLPGCTTLSALLPSWASSGGPKETLARLENDATKEKIRIAVEVTGCDGGHGIPTNWDEIEVSEKCYCSLFVLYSNCDQIGSTTHPDLEGYAGHRVAEVAKSKSRLAIEIFFEVLVKDQLATACLMHIGNEENVRTIMRHPTHMGGSDAILHGKTLHPRAWGTFPRYLGHYARDLGHIALPEMIAHLTSRPAKRLGVYPHRGLVREGAAADLVLFDPHAIKDMATHAQPTLPAKGVRFVLVNGQVALDEGKCTGIRAGSTLRRRADGLVSSKGL
jgi:N-acyl-D-aspartate/D-glutamate deacylase